MKERPIIMSAPMVRAILDGRKTQTRRVVKGVRMFSAEHDARWNPHVIRPGGACPDSWSWWEGPAHGPSMYHEAACPYGRPGDRLWVRETFIREPHPSELGLTREQLPSSWDHACAVAGTYHYAADRGSEIVADGRRWSPSIHMPRIASRITLEVTGVRVERLKDISEKDADAEGCPLDRLLARDWYSQLWESINGPGSWSANPWVWVVEFKRAAQRGEGQT